jgi:hypothetical protein
MSNPLNLSVGKKYRVRKEFKDFDHITHPVGEEWLFVKTNFVPHADGLTLHVKEKEGSSEKVFRFQWTDDAQAAIIQNFSEYVEAAF